LPDQRLLTLGDDRIIRVWASGSNQPQAATIAFEPPILSLTSIAAQTCLIGSATGQLIKQEL
jgi:hypothetical protein